MAKRKLRAVRGAKPLARLEPDELTAVRLRYDLWQRQEMISRMMQESYLSKVREVRAKYELPPQFEIDFETGAATLGEQPEPEAVDG